MNHEEIKKAINTAISGQGNQVGISAALADILTSLADDIDAIKNTHALMIQSHSNTSAGGYQVPTLTADDVTSAYNAVVSGRAAIIIDKDEILHAYVNQADALNGEISIGILFYSYLLLTYTLEGNNVTITTTSLGND